MTRHRLRVGEALLFLAFARFTVAVLPFGAWRGVLGHPVARNRRRSDNGSDREQALVRSCVQAVNRAAQRMPGALCLPQAMALQWMLSRRRIFAIITIGVLKRARVAHPDRLHAWVEWNGAIVLGDSGGAHVPLISLAPAKQSA